MTQLPFRYTYTNSTSTNSTSINISISEEIRHWLNWLDQPKIRKPYLPNQIKRCESNYKKPTIFKPFLGNKFKVGSSKT